MFHCPESIYTTRYVGLSGLQKTTGSILPCAPRADSTPAERTPAREETPAPEAANWLADPAAHVDRQAEYLRALDELANGPQWSGPLPSKQPEAEESTE